MFSRFVHDRDHHVVCILAQELLKCVSTGDGMTDANNKPGYLFALELFTLSIFLCSCTIPEFLQRDFETMVLSKQAGARIESCTQAPGSLILDEFLVLCDSLGLKPIGPYQATVHNTQGVEVTYHSPTKGRWVILRIIFLNSRAVEFLFERPPTQTVIYFDLLSPMSPVLCSLLFLVLVGLLIGNVRSHELSFEEVLGFLAMFVGFPLLGSLLGLLINLGIGMYEVFSW